MSSTKNAELELMIHSRLGGGIFATGRLATI
jgi:hypothetical protein